MNTLTESETITNLIQAGTLQHIGIIMDGNRRWAEQNQLMSVQGHYHGYQALKKIVAHCSEVLKLPVLTVYAFSTENWRRTEKEVGFLTGLLGQVLANEMNELVEKNIQIRFIGDLTAFPKTIREQCHQAQAASTSNTGLIFQVALNYGGRLELVRAFQQLAQQVQNGQLTPDVIDELMIAQHLFAPNVPDPDMIIRTGGEYRMSNFLLWQSAYSELYVSDEYWPAFTPSHLEKAIQVFCKRQRRFGQ